MSKMARRTAALALLALALLGWGCVIHPVHPGPHGGGHRYHQPPPAGFHGHPGRRW